MPDGLGSAAARLFTERVLGVQSKWYCQIDGCDGRPHVDMHWCEHPIESDDHEWECRHARANQKPPAAFQRAEARIWLIMAGRGFGKTRTGSEWLADQAKNTPKSRWAAVAPTRDDVQEICFEGESGILAALGLDREYKGYNKSKLQLRLPNGATIVSFSAAAPEKVRGPNLYGAYLEEIASWKDRTIWDNLLPAIRRGKAQTVIATTPKPVPLVREFSDREDGSVVVTTGSTFDNQHNLAAAAVAELQVRWKGTRRERQELFGELLADVPGALWTPETLELTRGLLIG